MKTKKPQNTVEEETAHVKITFNDKPRILNVYSSNGQLELVLTDKKGKMIEQIMITDDGKAMFDKQ